MKIFEIENLNLTPKQVKTKQGVLEPYVEPKEWPKKGTELLGKGVTAFAITKGSKPHEVRRITFDSMHPRFDPYIRFLKIAIKHQDNPFFPKIYLVKIFKKSGIHQSRGKYFYYTELERLSSWEKLSWAQWSQLYNQYFGTSLRDAQMSDASKSGVAHDFSLRLAELIKDPRQQRWGSRLHIKNIDDKNLKQAVNALKLSLGGSELIRLDLHKDNVMYRFTPYGTQPVITDPFYYS